MTAFRRVFLDDSCVACARVRVGRLPLCAACRRELAPATRAELETATASWPEIASVTALWHMERGSSARAVIHALKYRSMPFVGLALGERLANAQPWPGMRIVVPIPLHAVRLRERGYNQASWIAQGMTRRRPEFEIRELLRRPRPGRSRTTLARLERQGPDAGEFEIAGAVDAGGDVLLVDDVFTTGATAASAARTLLAAGARSVHVAVVGLTLARRRVVVWTGS